MKRMRNIGVVLAVLGCVAALLIGLFNGSVSAQGATATSADGRSERPVIVDVEGDAANGFGIHYSDGSSSFPPTDSETRAECAEYDTRIKRVRCRVEARTWFRDLRELQRSLDYVRSHGR